MKRKKFLLIIFILAVLVRLIYLGVAVDNSSWQGDDKVYNEYALSVMSGEWLTTTKYFDRMPLYPVFLGIIYFLFGQSVLIAKIFQVLLLSAPLCIVIYFLGNEMFNEKIARIATVVSVFYYGLIRMAGYLYTETLFTLLLGLSVLCLFFAYKTVFKEKKYLLFTGILIALATLTRPLTLIWPAFIALWLCMINKNSLKANIKTFLWIVIPFLLVYSPWVIRNYYVYKHFVPTMVETGYAFYAYNVGIPGKGMGIEKDHIRQEYADDLVKKDKSYLAYAKEFLKDQDIKYFIKLFIIKFGFLLYPFLPLYDVTFGILIPFFLLGIYGIIKRKEKAGYIIVFLYLNLLIQTLVFSGLPRFRAPMSPFYILLSIYVVTELFKTYGMKKLRVILTSWIVVNIMIFIFSDNIRNIVKMFWGI